VGHWKDKYVIGLTGNIAMGKSLVLRMLQHLGAYTIDADALTHRVMAPNAPAYKPVVQTFGQFILTPQKEIDRNKLAAIAFSDPDALKKLEAITHPLIRGAIDMLVRRSDKYVVVIEAIKLVEGELANQVDAIWVVDASPENQMRRLVGKRGMSAEEAKRRITLQNPQKDKLSRANVVITNNETPEKTWMQVQAAWRSIPGVQDTTTVATVQVTPQPAPAPAPSPSQQVGTPAPTPLSQIISFDIKRPQPKDFDKIAALINKMRGTSLDRSDIMAHFGEKTYLLAESNNTPLGVIAYLVENLITRVDEFVVESAAPTQQVGQALIKAMEDAAEELQSEVVFVFLSHNVDGNKPIFEKSEYQETTIESIQYPIWREAVKESKPQDARIFSKRLREKPIQVPI
jgi:dephospho-CoA kinase